MSSLIQSTPRLVFEALREAGEASRAELAKTTRLSAPTVGKVADELLSQGLLEEVESPAEIRAGIGRPSRPLRLNRAGARLIAVQIGVRHTRLAALPVSGPADVHWPVTFETPGRLSTFIERLKSNRPAVAAPWAVAVSVPGVVDEPAGNILLSPNLHWLKGTELAEALSKIWKAPLCFVQEIRALALGHLWTGKAADDFLLVDFGEGLGGTVVARGRLFDAPLPLSGELGHSRVPGNTRPCGCGATGCLETIAARGGLLRSFREAHRGAEASWRALVAHVDGNGLEPWLANALDAAGAVIGSSMNLVGIRNVVVTGALTELPTAVMERLSASIRASAMWARFGEISVVAAPRHRAAGLVSAALDRVVLPRIEEG